MIGVIDTAKSVIWNHAYYGTGDFEIYIQATPKNVELLKVGNYVTRSDDRNVGLIERIDVTMSAIDGRMIVASGRFAKILLGRRIIYNMFSNSIRPVISSGNVETAMRKLVNDNMIAATDSARNIPFFELGAVAGLNEKIIDDTGNAAQKQTSFENLLEYTDSVLAEYFIGAYVGMNRETLKLQYNVYKGVDRSTDNANGNIPIVFSQEFDNLLSSEYYIDDKTYKNVALIGGEGEGTERFFSLLVSPNTGINRRELFVDASGQSRTYRVDDVDKTYTDAEYHSLLVTRGKQEFAKYTIAEHFAGVVDVTNNIYQFGVDYDLGDVVTVQDNALGKYINSRIVRITEVQDETGYNINIEFGV